MSQVFREAVSIEALNALSRNTLIDHLGIVFTAAGEDWISATMPVDARTRQPYGILHGGASVVLAETLGSSAGNLCVDTTQQVCVGLEITPTTSAPCAAAWSPAPRVRCTWAAVPMCGTSASKTRVAAWCAPHG